MKVDILGVKVDQINISQAVEKIEQWLASQGETLQSHYIVTPNIEFVMLAQQDDEFRKILNNADLAIPDSSRFGWVIDQINEKNLILKILKWPLFLIPQLFHFDTVTGTDLMEELIKRGADQAFSIGLLGGRDKVAVKLARVLKKKYPKIKVTFAASGGEVNDRGQMYLAPSLDIPPTDILFIAFGHLKQEKWIAKNLNKYPVKVMMGVGGAFDYLSGKVPRAPGWVQNLGFEWLFRLGFQPWRIKRFWSLIKFIFLVTYK